MLPLPPRGGGMAETLGPLELELGGDFVFVLLGWRETGQVWPIFFDVVFLKSVDLFSRPDHLNGHIKQVHTSERPHKCQVGTGPGYSWVEECCCPPSLGLSTALHPPPHSCHPCPASGLLCSILSLLCFPRATSLFFWSLVSSLHRFCLHSVA